MRKTKYAILTMLVLFTSTGMNIGCAVAKDVDFKKSQVKARKDERRKKLTFVVKNKSKRQTLIVEPISEYKIYFVLNIDGACKKSVSGVAVGVNGDPELEEDETGDTYPAISYIFEKKDYSLDIRIAMEVAGDYKRDRAALIESGDKSSCPVISKTMHIMK
jgi:hypothetical protein